MALPRRSAPAALLALLLLGACDSDAANLAKEITDARGDCTQEKLRASDTACVEMMEKYARIGTSAIETYIGAVKSMDQALQRMPPASFDTAGFGHALTPGSAAAGAADSLRSFGGYGPARTGARDPRDAPGYDSGYDPRDPDPRYDDPRYDDPRYRDPRNSDPRYPASGYADPGYADPGYGDPRDQEPRFQEPRDPGPGYADPRAEGAGRGGYGAGVATARRRRGAGRTSRRATAPRRARPDAGSSSRPISGSSAPGSARRGRRSRGTLPSGRMRALARSARTAIFPPIRSPRTLRVRTTRIAPGPGAPKDTSGSTPIGR